MGADGGVRISYEPQTIVEIVVGAAPNAPTLEEIVRERPELVEAPSGDEHLRVWAAMPTHWQNSISPDQLRIAIDAVDTVRAAQKHGRTYHGAIVNETEALPIGDDLTVAAINALRSYEYGNSSPDLAKHIADKLSAARRGTISGT
jgi:hypothetical protein